MSYPAGMRVLIVEDETKPKDDYASILDRPNAPWTIGQRHFAFTYEDAVALLEEGRPYHLVVLDLAIPEKKGQLQEVELGLAVLKRCQLRETYPVPALLIVSGQLGKTQQSELSERVEASFYYGRVIHKGGDIEPEIDRAFEPRSPPPWPPCRRPNRKGFSGPAPGGRPRPERQSPVFQF